jgi:hypothetical protein
VYHEERGDIVKRAILILIIGLAMSALVPVASADKPTREFLPSEDFVIEGICSFSVDVHILANNSFITTFSDGRQLITGTLKVRLTNLDDPSKSLEVNISGPGVQRVTEEGEFVLMAEGRWLFFFFPGDLGAGDPGFLAITTGLAILRIDTEGNFSFTHRTGTTTDVCVALA